MPLKSEGKGPIPPLLKQYVELRDQHPDYLVLFQVGDFYECFGEDAERLARALNLILTHKSAKDFTTPMAGLPLRSVDTNVEKLLKQGIRVAIADQVQSAADAEGLVKREVTQLMTPGTVTDEKLLKPDANYVAGVATGDGYGLALLDVSTGEFRGTHLYSKASLYDELQRYNPAEVLLAPELYEQESFRENFSQRFSVMLTQGRFENAEQALMEHFTKLPSGLRSGALLRAAGAILSYALETQRGKLPQVTGFILYDPGAYMNIGEVALATLEVFDTRLGEECRTLFAILDDTRTAPGRRLLQAWIRHPLLDKDLIAKRLDAVEALVVDSVLRQDLRKALFKMNDLERLATRLSAATSGARELVALARSLSLIPEIKASLADRSEATLQSLNERLKPLTQVSERVETSLVEEPPTKITEGGLLQDGVDKELDLLREKAKAGRSWISELESKERATTNIPTLKIGFNGVFGYYLEVTRPYYEQVPETYRAIQTLKDRQRYTRNDLREKEREILRAEDSAKQREHIVFDGLRQELEPHAEEVRAVGAVLAELDVFTTLANIAAKRQYCRPIFTNDNDLDICAGRHPVVEQYHEFIPNDLHMSERERLLVLTGPNMSGKSTFLRQAALIVLLAQIGSFVPAEEAKLPIFERIYTRIGAADDIASGRSTFMVEMDELGHILQHATTKSLILLDEIGRGTSTYDGLSLAWAASEYLHNQVKAFTLFATHYFELTSLANKLPAARNYHVAAKEEAGGLIFYHQVLEGPASKSYGLQVAKLAGLPNEVLERASQVMAGLESSQNSTDKDIIETILGQDLNQISPLGALELLHKLQEKVKGWNPS